MRRVIVFDVSSFSFPRVRVAPVNTNEFLMKGEDKIHRDKYVGRYRFIVFDDIVSYDVYL